MVEKRPYPNDGSLQNGIKRPRSNNASPAPPTNGTPRPDIAAAVARAKARAAEVAARLQQGQGAASPTTASASPAPPASTGQNIPGDTAARLAAIKARMEAMKAKTTPTSSTSTPPLRDQAPFPPPPPLEYDEPAPRARGGLGIGLHPALMGDSSQDARSKGKQAMAPKFATTMANRRTESPVPKRQLDLSGPTMEEIKQNPYFDPSIGGQNAGGRDRISRKLLFNQKGKYIDQASKLRAQARLEKIKKDIAEQARRAGLDENNEKGFIVPAPPEVEWWDEGLLAPEKTYDALDAESKKLKYDTDDSPITHFVQHPVLLKAPQEQLLVPIKAMYLTTKEQAKVRRMRRAAEHKEKQAKIRLGLEPPPPPKVKRGNMMRVMGEQAIADPTAVEMVVEAQIRERAEGHERMNEERRLTKDERHEKLATQQQTDAQKGLHMCVFKIDSLAYGKHRYQVDINAKQNALTGITILHPKANLVVVEGGIHSINAYKKLMLHRIKWTENAMPSSVREGNREIEAQWLQSVDDQGNLKDMSLNKCTLIFEGEVKQRAFRNWKSKVCETESDAKDALSRARLDSFWVQARSMS